MTVDTELALGILRDAPQADTLAFAARLRRSSFAIRVTAYDALQRTKNLEAHGWVTCDRANRRLVNIRITPAGRRLLQQLQADRITEAMS